VVEVRAGDVGQQRAEGDADQQQRLKLLVDAEIEQLQQTAFQGGQNAWEYIKSQRTDIQRWTAISILSCMKKGYSLNKLTINWELRDLRFADNPKYRR